MDYFDENLVPLIVFFISYKANNYFGNEILNLALNEVKSVTFFLIIIALTVVFTVGNRVLDFLGKHVFEIYMLQRLPMMIFKDLILNKYLFFVAAVITTLILAIVFKKVESILNKQLFQRRTASVSN